uniref:HMA domain-containing protein n=1 Tax=Nelumbo nucifera TaxID=4432 RepID=A0A822YHS8_NELNU|nr:TPA_asm: hypothetical protein HUJ06_010853 [Nelumbo nucifera]
MLNEKGVYTVNIDAEQQKVTVSGSVDSATLIKKLVKSGKHAELWSAKSNQNQKQQQQQSHGAKDNKTNNDQKQGLIKGLQAFKNQQKFPTFGPEYDEFDCSDEDEDEDEDELRFIRDKIGHLGLLRQQANQGNNAKKGDGGVPVNNNGKLNNGGNGNAGKKAGGGGGGGNPTQNMGMKAATGIDQKNMGATKMNNVPLGGGNATAGKANDINTMLNLSGFHGQGAGIGGLGGNGLGIQAQANNGLQGSSSGFPGVGGGFATGGQHLSPMMMANMQGYQQFQNPSSVMNMNMQNRHNINNMMMNESRYMQPQMMYHRSPIIPPNTGYYYNYDYSHAPHPGFYPENRGDHSAAYTFNDEYANSCAVM